MEARQPLPFWHPASLIATWFGSGLLPAIPGTWGSLAALPFAALIVRAGGSWALLIAALAAFLIGLWAGARYADSIGQPDPGKVVIDEVAGMWLALLPAVHNPFGYAIAFLFFRIFDILKIWPANVVQARLKGGLGIMADDIVAGLYAGALTWAALAVMEL